MYSFLISEQKLPQSSTIDHSPCFNSFCFAKLIYVLDFVFLSRYAAPFLQLPSGDNDPTGVKVNGPPGLPRDASLGRLRMSGLPVVCADHTIVLSERPQARCRFFYSKKP